jgi:parallel beta-helix repeat protein
MKRSILILPFVFAACAPDAITPPAPNATVAAAPYAFSSAPCTFTVSGNRMTLDGDCSTSESIVIPDGFTLDGADHSITAVDPEVGLFLGGVLRNGGSTANVVAVHVRALGLANGCSASSPTDNRLRGILFDGAAGSITHSSVVGINKGASGCQEGNAIEVRNGPFDGTHPNTRTVEISHNTVDAYQKTGIICNGDVSCSISHNDVGASATQANLAANSVQLGFGALGDVSINRIVGNSWCGPSDFASAAILLFDAGSGVVVESNRISGNSDVGIYASANGASITKNDVDDVGADCNANLYDIGIGDYGSNYPDPSNSVTKSKVSGFDTPYDPPTTGGKNQVKKPKGGPAGS